MSEQYDERLAKHRANVKKGYNWIKRSLPELIPKELASTISFNIDFHDDTKTIPDEYEPLDQYYFGKKTRMSESNKRMAKLAHFHRNPHHWQHWVLITDGEGVVTMDMPYECIFEMVCDWWSHSWEQDDLWEIFDYYEKNKKTIKISKRTRNVVEDILEKLETKLTKVRGPRKKVKE